MDRLKTIEAFIAVSEAGSFSAAARNMRQSRPLVSRQIADLEGHLGLRLFSRTTREISLTSAGRQYLDVCSRVVRTLHETEADLANLQQELRGTLRLVSVRSFGERHMGAAIADFSRMHPDLRLEMELAPGIRTALQLARNGFDMGIAIAPAHALSTVVRKVAEFDWVLCANREYLERAGAPRDISELREHVTMINPRHAPGGVWMFHRKGKPERVRVQAQIAITNFWSLREAVMAGAGIAVLPSFCIMDELERGVVIPLLRDAIIDHSVIRSHYPHYKNVPRKARVFSDFLEKRFGSSFLLPNEALIEG